MPRTQNGASSASTTWTLVTAVPVNFPFVLNWYFSGRPTERNEIPSFAETFTVTGFCPAEGRASVPPRARTGAVAVEEKLNEIANEKNTYEYNSVDIGEMVAELPNNTPLNAEDLDILDEIFTENVR